ncbi:MAG: hypothetical protein AAFQ94_06775 [Bacteroidota bacterium]
MQKLILEHESLLKGSFTPGKLNFLLVFQVNCPGCFIYAIPMVNRLYREFSDQISFLGLSTAFEDFDLNTEENTKRLLFNNEIIGETKKVFEHQGLTEFPYPVEFPVAMDRKAGPQFDYEAGAEFICNSNPNYKVWSQFDQQSLTEKVVSYLKNQQELALTFTLNQLKGTPSMIIFNDQLEIFESWFGHVSYEIVQQELKQMTKLFD